ncbi:MAG: hypothetical protein OEZ16_10695 [Chromatiales bacterium]|nr:hypothetical protein [Chromatiales bacterium]
MGKITNFCDKTHYANTRRITRRVLNIIGLTACGNDLMINGRRQERINNWSVITFIINHMFPVPLLAKVTDPSVVEDVVLEVLIIEGMLRKPKPEEELMQQAVCSQACTYYH